MIPTYNPQIIEEEAQTYWESNKAFQTKEDLNLEKFYCLAMLPYPSGELHMGHVRNYALSDLIARHAHLEGKNVLQPMGWDAFGLPAENAAIKHNLPPAEWTEKNIKKMRKQFKLLGFAYDWSREITTCQPNYYRWEQWLFIQLFKQGLVYKKNAIVNWDPVDQTVLANEQVVDGKGWRSGAPVERREISQWFIKITDYAEQLLDGLDELTQWPEQVCQMQRHWIGRSEGSKIKFTVLKQPKNPITVFTTRADTLMGVCFISIALEHPLAKIASANNPKLAAFIKKMTKTKVSEADIEKQAKKGLFTGLSAIHPLTKKHIPIWVTNFVLMEYGTGAVMGVPAHDQRDFEFANEYNLPMKAVIKPSGKNAKDIIAEELTEAFTGPGILFNSDEFNGLTSKKAILKITEKCQQKNTGEHSVNYRLRDWGISRQRYWGTPIPIIYCKECGTLPVPEKDLPVRLPTELIPNGQSSPLKTDAGFIKVKCPECGKSAKRETDTMDTFVESSWYYTRYCCHDQDNSMLDDRAKYWTPVDQYVGGIEHAVMHLLYARFMHKVLRDMGLVNSSEPFTKLLTQGMILKDGAKMSKSKGNTVSPQSMVKQYGSDAVRFFIIFSAPPEQSLEWIDTGIEGAFRFIKKLWHLCLEHKAVIIEINESKTFCSNFEDKQLSAVHSQLHFELKKINFDIKRQRFNTVASGAMKIVNLCQKIKMELNHAGSLLQEGISIALRILHPITPHITHHLWKELGFGDNILKGGWPKVNNKALVTESVEMVVQINGKRRANISVLVNDSDETIKEAALSQERIKTHLVNKTIIKSIVVPKRLINLVVKKRVE
jgi:leucyl-tRNA synthetase